MTDQQFWSVLASAFGGGCLGACITGLINWCLNRKNYRDDYYKKIIDKRIEAYENINSFIESIAVEEDFLIPDDIECKRVTKLEYFSCCRDFETLNNTLEKTMMLAKYLGWLSSDARHTFIQINNLFSDMYKLFTTPNKETIRNTVLPAVIHKKNFSDKDNIYIGIGVEHKFHSKMEIYIKNMKQIIHNDYIKMDNVENFLKNNKK